MKTMQDLLTDFITPNDFSNLLDLKTAIKVTNIIHERLKYVLKTGPLLSSHYEEDSEQWVAQTKTKYKEDTHVFFGAFNLEHKEFDHEG
jgi:hypothetical protein